MLNLLKKISALIALSTATIYAVAQGLPTLADVRKVTDSAMERVGGGDVEGGLKLIRPLVPVTAAEFDAMVAQLPPQLPGIKARYGSSVGWEFIREHKVGDSLALLVYLNRLEKHGMRVLFYCYRGANGWTINSFRYDDKWHELF